MTERLTAQYHSHETGKLETVTQEFEGDTDFISYEYFEIFGDRLLRLFKDGEVIYQAPWVSKATPEPVFEGDRNDA